MQVQLVVTNKKQEGHIIPVNVPSFKIGRAEGCHLQSSSSSVSPLHCVIDTHDGAVSILDLGSENGTYVNGNRISSPQGLQNGDKITVGKHSFLIVIAISPGTYTLEPQAKPESEPELTFDVMYEGQQMSVSKDRLFRLAQNGAIAPDDLITIAGTKVFADSIKGIVFGKKPSKESPPPAAVAEPEPYTFPGFGGSKSDPFNVNKEPTFQIVRPNRAHKSVMSEIGEALGSSLEQVSTPEGKSFFLRSLKPLGYTLGVVCFLAVFWFYITSEKKNTYGAVYLEGTLTLDGAPVAGADVILNPRDENGMTAGGITDKRGRFRVTTGLAALGSGARPGKYDVTFYKVQMEAGSPSAEEQNQLPAVTYLVPQKYESPATSGLEPIIVDTDKAKNKFKFALVSDGQMGDL